MTTIAEAVPEAGIRPVSPVQRVLGARENFVLWFDLGISFLVMVVGMFLVPGLGLAEALLAIVVGAVIGNVLLGLAATIGSDNGVPSMVLLRAPLGVRGSYLPTALNILQLLGWASLEVIVMAQAANLLAGRLGLPSAYQAWVLFFAVVTTLMALGGPIRVVKQWMEKFAFWAVLVTTVWITGALLVTYDIGALLSRPGTGGLSFWLAVDLVVAMPISWFPLVADYSRFSRSRSSAFWGTAVGYFLPHAWFYALGAMLVLAAGVVFDPAAPIVPLLGAIAGLTAGWLALVTILVDETDEGFANIYSTAVSLQNLVPRLGQQAAVVGVGLVVLVIASTIPMAQYESFLLLIGSAFVPLLGLAAADYFVLRRGRYREGDFFAGPAVRWTAVAVWTLGVATYLLISGLPALGIQGLAPWLGASLPSFLVTFLLHAGLGRLAPVASLPAQEAG